MSLIACPLMHLCGNHRLKNILTSASPSNAIINPRLYFKSNHTICLGKSFSLTSVTILRTSSIPAPSLSTDVFLNHPRRSLFHLCHPPTCPHNTYTTSLLAPLPPITTPFLSISAMHHNNDYHATVSVMFLLSRPAHQATIVS